MAMIFHFRRDDAGAGIGDLGDGLAVLGPAAAGLRIGNSGVSRSPVAKPLSSGLDVPTLIRLRRRRGLVTQALAQSRQAWRRCETASADPV